MGKKKDCFGSETYVCMTPNCPYADVGFAFRSKFSRPTSRLTLSDILAMRHPSEEL